MFNIESAAKSLDDGRRFSHAGDIDAVLDEDDDDKGLAVTLLAVEQEVLAAAIAKNGSRFTDSVWLLPGPVGPSSFRLDSSVFVYQSEGARVLLREVFSVKGVRQYERFYGSWEPGMVRINVSTEVNVFLLGIMQMIEKKT